jgi:cytochrome P450
MEPLQAASSANPYLYYAELVANRPFYKEGGLWIASSAAAVTAVFESELCRVRPPAEPVPRALLGTPVGEMFRQMARMNDGAAHRALKPLLVEGLGQASVAQAAAACAAELSGKPIGDFIFQLAPASIARLFGIEIPAFLARDLARAVTLEQIERGSAAYLRIREALVGSRSALMAALLRNAKDPEPVLANVASLFFQIYDATAGLIGNTLLAPRAEPRPAVLETLRWDPPIQNTRRFVAKSGVLFGQEVSEGDVVLLSLAAANRDPAREESVVFSFGAGIHACPGRNLAVEIATAGVSQLAGVELPAFTYLQSPNARVPLFGAVSNESL